ncbi:putative ubiquitin thioesterase [Phytophthora ramorum]|uniref:putative ubiquitin thioesterase n=1 Tax=Phytophthora ramorum TaxID=164328 RepID=UPI0030B26006|nr:putative ubiquitin thioesterase [Phytophthora ramorum]
MDVGQRLVARRAHLAPFCRVDPVKQHLRLQSYYQLARQLYRQSETYFAEGAWDNAYVFLAKFIKLCSKVVTAHHDYELPRYRKEREWVRTQAADGSKLFDAILDGMEAEELEYLEYEQSLTEEKEQNGAARANDQTNVTALEAKLLAMRLAKKNPEQTKVQVPTEKEDSSASNPSTSVRPRINHSLETHQKERSKTVSYPTVGKASWMTADDSLRAHKHYSAPPLSRQRSQEAIANLTSGKIRTLEIPAGIIAQFTLLASPNTNKPPYGIETCGILAGILHDRKLVITTLIIPKQEGSSDMCTMTNEEELYDFCFSNELLTLGWIHTHPKQDCFLSSVDVHTQCGFQSILPEAVAIVVAPSDPHKNVGVFRLTEPAGLQLIQNCNLTGFHTHPSQIEVYSNAFECKWLTQITAQLVDMR